MRIKKNIALIILYAFMILPNLVLIAQDLTRTGFMPPHRVTINSQNLRVSWEAPREVIFLEDFEDVVFPPENWTMLSNGIGWQRTDTILCNHWKIPAHPGSFSLMNDDNAAPANNGIYDLLITPPIDLTLADSLFLRFESYFDGAYGHAARVEYSLDNGGNWNELQNINPSLDWKTIDIDLSDLSTLPGAESAMFAFFSSDNGLDASGWAIDNVEISNSLASNEPLDYVVIYDSLSIDTTANLHTFIPTLVYTYNQEHIAGVSARYPGGYSDTIYKVYCSSYLFPPYDLISEPCGEHCIGLSWSGPYRPPDCLPWELQAVFPTPEYWSEGGSASDGAYIYIVYENMNRIAKMDLEGNLTGMYVIPGVPSLTDIAFDWNYGYFYGCCGTQTVYVMDLYDNVLISQFQAPIVVFSITYDYQWDAFWGNDHSSDFTLFDRDGSIITSFPTGNYGNFHGLAFDGDSDWGPYLWGFSRDSTGCLLVQYEVATGTPTGFTMDLSGLTPNGGLASGLFFSFSLFQHSCLTLGGNIQNEIVFGYALGEHHPPGWTPEGIWGYYIFKNGELFDSIEIHCEKYPYFIWYPEDELPQFHNFSVSVKYELDMFGLEDQIAFSEKAGPVRAGNSYGQEMDLWEDWASAQFLYNQWDTAGKAWKVHPNQGNLKPSACYYRNPGEGPYIGQLTSYPFLPDTSATCSVSFHYDLKYSDPSPSGTDTLLFELWESSSRKWRVLRKYSNDTICTAFLTDGIDMGSKLKDKHFMIRFTMFGDDHDNAFYWLIDNIRVERSCPAPTELASEYHAETQTVELSWQAAEPETTGWIHVDDSTQSVSAGLTTGPDTWCDVAVRWSDYTLEEHHQAVLEQIAFIPSDPESHYILKVWTEDSARSLKSVQPVSDLMINQWNVVDLDKAVTIDGSQELWIGYSFSAKGEHPLSLDAGPAVDGYGNLCRIGDAGWTTLLEFNPALDGNLNIQGFLHTYENNGEGYELFRKMNDDDYLLLARPAENAFSDSLISINSSHCYKVRSICTVLTDTLRSGFSEESCIIPVNVIETSAVDSLCVYPNPTNGIVYIKTGDNFLYFDLFDCAGRNVLSGLNIHREIGIDLSGFPPGIYLLKCQSGSGTSFKKIILLK
jgi:hypothetical protein